MELGQLITWLEKQDPALVVSDGIGQPHTDRSYYYNLAFDPVDKTTIGEMLNFAKSAIGSTYEGYKGGDYTMQEQTEVFIGLYGDSGEPITSYTLKYWLLSAKTNNQ